MKSSVLILSMFLLAGASAAAPLSSRECHDRLDDIASGRLSGDDTLVLSDCTIAGHIAASDIERAYEQAKKRQK